MLQPIQPQAARPTRPANQTLNILVVDDQKAMRSIIRRLLSQEGLNTTEEAENGAVALERLARLDLTLVDVVLCDLHMDTMDGMEFCALARRDARVRKVGVPPILLLTGEKDNFILEAAATAGAAAVLRKPISSPDLVRAIGAAIGLRIAR